MNDYVIYTDSSCDLKPDTLKEWGIRCIPLTFTFVGDETEYTDNDIDSAAFYQMIRDGGIARTAAINPDVFSSEFEKALADGYDVIYTGLSGALSSTYNSAKLAAAELSDRYPDRRVMTVDSLSASGGLAMLLYLACRKKAEGATVDEVAAYIEDTKLKICHWFAVDDLECLKRGGRISSTVAVVGTVLGIKPILHVNDEGKPVSAAKARGKKAVISMLADKYGELAEEIGADPVYISHADNAEDAEKLKAELESRYGVSVSLVADIGTVLGAHVGPGTIAFFFVGKHRV